MFIFLSVYFVVRMIQRYSQKQIQEPLTPSTSATVSTSYQSKRVRSLDNLLIGYVKVEENNKMIITDNNGNLFIIPNFKVISVYKHDATSLIVDIEHSVEVEHLPG